MRRMCVIAILLPALAAAAEDLKTGQFETGFTERSPLSAKTDLLKRLNEKEAGVEDYDLSKELFMVYVPANYNPATPHGLMFYIGYKATSDTPEYCWPTLDKAHMIFVTARGNGQPEWARAGLALDAIHNLKKSYSIDENRIYLAVFPQGEQTIGFRMGMSMPDIFSGFIYITNFWYFRDVPRGNGNYIPAAFAKPQGTLFGQSKSRKHVFAIRDDNVERGETIYKAFVQDGFKQTFVVRVNDNDVHYPRFLAPWLEKTLAYLDGSAAASVATTLPADAKTGEFETTFTERSPLSGKRDLLARLNQKDAAGDDYDLAKEQFIVYVPPNYTPTTPHGVIYWMGYKDIENGPIEWKPLLDQSHLIFVTAKNSKQSEWARAGLALDVLHNIKKQYKIDEKRIYLFASPYPDQMIGQQMGWAMPDVFNGFVYLFNLKYFRQIPAPNSPGTFYSAKMPRAQGPMFTMSKTRRHVLASTEEQSQLIQKAYVQDGFSQSMALTINIDDIHYPHLRAAWLEKVLAFLDAPSPAAPTNAPTSAPAPAPDASEAQRILKLAKTYISANRFEPARTKLQELINKYPNDAVAAEAKQILEQIKDKK